MTDHPHIRNRTICPLCRGQKDRGLVVCWPCHRKEKRENNGGYSAEAERILDMVERRLETTRQVLEGWSYVDGGFEQK